MLHFNIPALKSDQLMLVKNRIRDLKIDIEAEKSGLKTQLELFLKINQTILYNSEHRKETVFFKAKEFNKSESDVYHHSYYIGRNRV